MSVSFLADVDTYHFTAWYWSIMFTEGGETISDAYVHFPLVVIIHLSFRRPLVLDPTSIKKPESLPIASSTVVTSSSFPNVRDCYNQFVP